MPDLTATLTAGALELVTADGALHLTIAPPVAPSPSTLSGTLTITVNGATYAVTFADVAPTGTEPPPPALSKVFAVSGQSNMQNAIPFFAAAGATTFGFAEGAQPISYWDVGANGWTQLKPTLTNNHAGRAFIWFQGETDNINGTTAAAYVAKLTDLIARVRAEIGIPLFPVWLAQINLQYPVINGALATVAASVPGVSLIQTSDLEWAADAIHLDNVGAAAFVARCLAHP